MSSPTDLGVLSRNIQKFLKAKIPADEVGQYFSSQSSHVHQLIHELDIATVTFNQFRHQPDFSRRQLYLNANNFDQIFKQDLPLATDIYKLLNTNPTLSDSVYHDLATDNYFHEVWQLKPIDHLVANLLLLIYRTAILEINRDILIDPSGNRLVQISSTIEEMVFHHHLLGRQMSILPAFKIWLTNWQEEGFSKKLYQAISAMIK